MTTTQLASQLAASLQKIQKLEQQNALLTKQLADERAAFQSFRNKCMISKYLLFNICLSELSHTNRHLHSSDFQ